MNAQKLTPKQNRLLWATARGLGLDSYDVHDVIALLWGHNSVHELMPSQFDALINYELQAAAKRKAAGCEPAVTITFAPMSEEELARKVRRF